MVDDELASLPKIDIRGDITRRRAKQIADADAQGTPRRPLGEIVREMEQIDRQRLAGDYARNK